VDGVKEGDVKDLLVKVFGLAARDPQQYCKVVKQKMKQQRLAMETFDLVAHQWTLDQYEMFDTIQDADCMEEHKMAPTDFAEHKMVTYKQFIPSLATIHGQDEIRGESWTVDILKDKIKRMAARGRLRVEESAKKEHAETKVGANKSKATGHGLNDHYHHDAFGEEREEQRDGEPRCDSHGYYSSPGYGKGREYYDQYPTNLQTATGNLKEKVAARAKATKAGKKARKVGNVEVAVAKTIVAAEATGGSQGGSCIAQCVSGQENLGEYSADTNRRHAIAKAATWKATRLTSVSPSSDGSTTGTSVVSDSTTHRSGTKSGMNPRQKQHA
jgi:hypothetical protein